MTNVVVVGSANIDLVVKVTNRPVAGETVIGSDLITSLGGKGANQAVAAARLGAQVRFIGAVGADEYGVLLADGLRSAGIDVTGLSAVDRATGSAMIVLTPDAENSIIVSPGANAAVDPALIDESAHLQAGDIVVVQLEIPMGVVERLAERAVSSGARLVVNAAPAAELSAAVLAQCDPLIVNETEAATVLGGSIRNPESAVAALLGLGPGSVVLTLGSRGSIWQTAAQSVPTVTPARSVIPVDTTGAGDGFVGALAAALAYGWPLDRAVPLATDVAAVAVTRFGAQSSYPTAAELELEWQ